MKKKWHERSDKEKRNIERYAEMQRKKSKAYHDATIRNTRLRRKEKIVKKELGLDKTHDSVSIIHWVSDPPNMLAQRFIEWRTRHEQ